MIEFYNSEASKWERHVERTQNVDAFVSTDSTKIKWTDRLKNGTNKGRISRVCSGTDKKFFLSSIYKNPTSTLTN